MIISDVIGMVKDWRRCVGVSGMMKMGHDDGGELMDFFQNKKKWRNREHNKKIKQIGQMAWLSFSRLMQMWLRH